MNLRIHLKTVLGMFTITFLFFFNDISFSQKKPFTIEDLYKVKVVGKPVISTSQNEIAFTVTNYKLKEGKSNIGIYVIDKDGNEITRIKNADKSYSNPIWSPDDKTLYYINDSQIYSYNLKTKESKQLTDWAMGISCANYFSRWKLYCFHNRYLS